ncbi:MAG: NAD(P)H-binding protein [Nannocystaceae bacterium]
MDTSRRGESGAGPQRPRSGPARREVVAVAGASGYIGTAVGEALRERYDTIGLSRSERSPTRGYPTWRAADLFSLREAERALAGVDRAVYLVHSMLPTERLTQGSFADLDLICADNFARAAARAGVKQIIYLGGIVPRDRPHGAGLSRHLESRLETEATLAAHGVPVTALRAGLVIGRGGSSFVILERLVRRLPVMVCPAWTRTRTQPIALEDVVAAISACLGRDDVDGAFDIGGPDVVTYQALMQRTAQAMGLRRPMVPVPLVTPRLSRLWVSLVTGTSKALVAPLIESLIHPMVARDGALQERLGLEAKPLDAALRDAVRPLEGDAAAPSRPRPRSRRRERPASLVKSAQRMRLPPGRDAEWVAREYMRWLPDALRPLLRVEREGDAIHFRLSRVAGELLTLRVAPRRSTADRQVFDVVGGRLADVDAGPRARLEFREALDGAQILAAIHDFVPRLPWPIYRATQAIVHLLVMRAFGRHLARVADRGRALDRRAVDDREGATAAAE